MHPEPQEDGRGRGWTPLRVTVTATAAFLVIGILRFGELYFDDLSRDHHDTFLTRLLEEATGTVAALLVFPALLWLCLRLPIRRNNWRRLVPLYFGAAVVVSALHTSLNWGLRIAAFSLAGQGRYDYGIMSIRYFMELPRDLIFIWVIIGVIHGIRWFEESRARELRTSQLETRLAQAQLAGLRSQLQPHFLFNALNTIAAAVWADPARADGLLVRLSELLRMALHAAPSHESSLAEELRVSGLYTDLMRARFEERFVFRLVVEPGLTDASVPQLVLQPLLENAVKHGADAVSGLVTVEVRCARNNGAVQLTVRDRGRGFPEPAAAALGRGVGLQNTAERLRHLYGESAALVVGNASDGGAVVTVTLPWRSTGAPAPAPR
jgi:two-component system, LytTR family, sensor kinase